jgi:hypothetical protein
MAIVRPDCETLSFAALRRTSVSHEQKFRPKFELLVDLNPCFSKSKRAG